MSPAEKAKTVVAIVELLNGHSSAEARAILAAAESMLAQAEPPKAEPAWISPAPSGLGGMVSR